MKNILKEIVLFTIILLLFIYSLTNNTLITEKIIYSTNIWLTKIVPTLFPTFIIVDLISNSKIPYYISKYLHINYIYILSIISGSPSNAYLLSNYNNQDLTKLLATTKYTSFIFMFGRNGGGLPRKDYTLQMRAIIYLNFPQVIYHNYARQI